MDQILEKLAAEKARLAREARERTAGYLTGALGLVAGLAWNDAIRSLIDVLYPAGTDTLIAKFAYALIITVAVVILSVYFIRLVSGPTKQ